MAADFVAHQELSGEASVLKWIEWANTEAKARGVQHVRVTRHPSNRMEFWYEGWMAKPQDDGPEPWKVD